MTQPATRRGGDVQARRPATHLSLTRVGVTFGGGIRFYPANHFVVGTEAGVVMLLGGAKGTSSILGDLSTSLESERRLFAVLQVGLAF